MDKYSDLIDVVACWLYGIVSTGGTLWLFSNLYPLSFF
jgi:hypothetical protein